MAGGIAGHLVSQAGPDEPATPARCSLTPVLMLRSSPTPPGRGSPQWSSTDRTTPTHRSPRAPDLDLTLPLPSPPRAARSGTGLSCSRSRG